MHVFIVLMIVIASSDARRDELLSILCYRFNSDEYSNADMEPDPLYDTSPNTCYYLSVLFVCCMPDWHILYID